MGALYITLLTLHMLAIAVWLGGGAFLGTILAPALRRPENRGGAAAFFERTALRFRTISWACLVTIVVTGLLTLFLRGTGWAELGSREFWTSAFGFTLGHKLVFVLVILILSVVNDLVIGPRAIERWKKDPDSPRTARLRKASGWMGRVTLVLAIVVIVLGLKLARGG